MSDKDNKRGYLGTAAAAAPIYAAKGAIVDMPKKGLEHAIANREPGSSFTRAFRIGALGRGLGGALSGATAGSLTAPIFVSGVKRLSSDDKRERAKGLAMVGGSSAAYSGLKGVGEDVGRKMLGGSGKSNYGLARLLLKTPTGVALGLSTAHAMKKEKKEGKPATFVDRYVKPGAVGAGSAFSTEVLSDLLSKKKLNAARLRRIGAGSVVGGGLAGVAASEVARRLVGGAKDERK